MSKYTITRACGHTETVNIGGKVSERDRQAAYESNKLCDACYQAKRIADRGAATAAAIESAKDAGLPVLQGSEKQVAWAETIRANMLKIAAILPKIEALEAADKADPVNLAVKRMILRVQACQSAKWFIDNRLAVCDSGVETMRGLLGSTSGLSVDEAIARADSICS